jgi:hypothetical protein
MINSVTITPEKTTPKPGMVLVSPVKKEQPSLQSSDTLSKTTSHSKETPKSEVEATKAIDTLTQVEATKAPRHVSGTLGKPIHHHISALDSEPLADGVKHLGEKVLERVSIGWKNMAYLTSPQCQKSKIGRLASKLDIPFFLLGFIPFLHFFWMIQPSVILFTLGAVFKKPIGHQYLSKAL